jgi:NADH:ubiquinone oxidoreductase subunit 6 (subunit J)
MFWMLADNFAYACAIAMLVLFVLAVFVPDGARFLRWLKNAGEMLLAVVLLAVAALTSRLWLAWLSWRWWMQLREVEREQQRNPAVTGSFVFTEGRDFFESGSRGDDIDYRCDLMPRTHSLPDDPA